MSNAVRDRMVLIGIGANLPDPTGRQPLETAQAAARALAELPGLQLVSVSHWWLTEPVPVMPEAPWYVNGVALLEGEVDPAWLLAQLQRLEQAAGRSRPYLNAPRSLDLDILAMGRLVRQMPDPILPHPRMHERGFVLRPLAELVPGWIHPAVGHSVEELLETLPPQAMRLLDATSLADSTIHAAR